MKVYSESKCYYVEAEKTAGEEINVTCGDCMSNLTTVTISKENWDKLVKAMK